MKTMRSFVTLMMLALGSMVLMPHMAVAAEDVISSVTNLRVTYYFTNEGKTYYYNRTAASTNWDFDIAIVQSGDLVSTNYDYWVRNTNSGNPYAVVFGRTNWVVMTVTNRGGMLSLADTVWYQTVLTNTGWWAGVYGDTDGDGKYTAGTDSATNRTGAFGRGEVRRIFLRVGVDGLMTNTGTVTCRLITRSTNYTNMYNRAVLTNTFVFRGIYPQAARFEIVHGGVALVSNSAAVVVRALDSASNVIVNYRGVVTLDENGGTYGSIVWGLTNGDGVMATNVPGAGRGVYRFAATDGGVVTLVVRDNTCESIQVKVRGDGITSVATNWLIFDRLEPYVKLMVPGPGTYATLSEMSNIRLQFSRPMDVATVTGMNVRVNRYLKSGSSVGQGFVMGTNGNVSSLTLHLTGVNRTNDILTRYEVCVSNGAMSKSGYGLIANPNNPVLYGSPYHGNIWSMVDRMVGGRISTNLAGIEIPKDVLLIANVNDLPESAYVTVINQLSSVASIRVANDKAVADDFQTLLANYQVKDIRGTNNSGKRLTELNGVTLELRYNEQNGMLKDAEGGEGVSEGELRVFWLNESTLIWEALPSPVVDTVKNTVTVKITKYGKYCLMGDRTPNSLKESFIVYPNPFEPGKQLAKLRFQLEKDGYVNCEVYTITGDRVVRLAEKKYCRSGQAYEDITWDGKNARKMVVVNGVYLVKITVEYTDGSGSDTKIWKVGVYK